MNLKLSRAKNWFTIKRNAEVNTGFGVIHPHNDTCGFFTRRDAHFKDTKWKKYAFVFSECPVLTSPKIPEIVFSYHLFSPYDQIFLNRFLNTILIRFECNLHCSLCGLIRTKGNVAAAVQRFVAKGKDDVRSHRLTRPFCFAFWYRIHFLRA